MKNLNKKEVAENVELEAPSIWLRPALQSGADWIACADQDVRDVFLNELEEGELLALPFLFEFWAMEHQLPPSGDWRSWVVMGGRGAGKTRAGAEWVRAQVEGACPSDPGQCKQMALIGETVDQTRDVMVFGESGIFACSPPDRRPEWQATRKRLLWPNGAIAQVFSAHDPEALRGPQFDGAWVDELAKWKRGAEAWDMLQFALRLGEQPQVCVTTTPRSVGVLKGILLAPSTVATHAPTEANKANLASSFLEEVERRYAGTPCEIKPKVEQKEFEGDRLQWSVSGLDRGTADEISLQDDRPVYGGTPSDNSVIEAIEALNTAAQKVMFYPFILMDQMEGNSLQDPWSGASSQPQLPWRGRITCSVAPSQSGSPDESGTATAQVAQFFGSASASDFSISDGEVSYSGPNEWRFRRFILHNAALCAAAGGVHSFCIGSEVRGLTQIRGAAHSFPTVTQLIALAGEVRKLLGPHCKIGYAADWSEYFGYSPQDGKDHHYFHLDPLWSDDNIDFIGIDNYMPLSDWRDGEEHVDAPWGSIYDIDYLKSNVEGGEGYDWYYHSEEARAAQIRTPITDGVHDEPWIYRYKDLKNWWGSAHHNRIAGTRQTAATEWIPQSKPIWFTEYGCAAIDKGTNQPNKFLDPKSSESFLPRYSNGQRDELMQMQYLRAVNEYWEEAGRNPVSTVYNAPMLDMSQAFVWAWDARPYPFFPNRVDLWSDGDNYWRGHWLNGRSTSRSLASVVAEICLQAGELRFDVSKLYGVVKGYQIVDVLEARSALQPLMLRFGFDAIEREGVLHFIMREGQKDVVIETDSLAAHSEIEGGFEIVRGSDADLAGRLRASFVHADADYDVIVEETVLPQDGSHAVSSSDLPLVMTRPEARQMLERWLSEARVSREAIRFALPPSKMAVKAGDIVRLTGAQSDTQFRVDRVEQGASQILEAVRIEPNVYRPAPFSDQANATRPFVPAVPVLPYFLDLPLITGNESPHTPHIAVTANPWPAAVAVYDAPIDANYGFNTYCQGRSTIGVTQTPLNASAFGVIDRGAPLRVKLASDQLESIARETLLSGGNLAAIGDGSGANWEIFQFERAKLVAPDTYELSQRLRGQYGTDGLVPAAWPVGSVFVLLNGVPNQIGLRSSDRDVQRHFKIGPAHRGYDDPAYEHLVETFECTGLRPYPPAHLEANSNGADVDFSWIRRTRSDGDDWGWGDVPLGEESEQYLIQIIVGGNVKRQIFSATAQYRYLQADQFSDNVTGVYEVRVAQISERFGPGLFASHIVGG